MKYAEIIIFSLLFFGIGVILTYDIMAYAKYKEEIRKNTPTYDQAFSDIVDSTYKSPTGGNTIWSYGHPETNITCFTPWKINQLGLKIEAPK